jgi:Reverse transcriptase (RNA-dependent DNA polymerase)/Endonuclease-reverse transcriptase
MSKLTILQYNCGNANYGKVRPWFDAASQAKHQVLAIQEPGYNKLSKTTYCPKGFTLLYEALPTTRVCFMVSKEINTAHWSYKQYGPYIAVLQLALHETTVAIINIYNPRGNRPRISIWAALETALEETTGEVILLGDFNAHHPAWGGAQAACEAQAEHLLHATSTRGLRLLTPVGDPTWKRGTQESVIDLTFATEAISERIEFCGTEDQWAITKDHIPIRIQANLAIQPQPPSKRFALGKIDEQGLRSAIQELPWASTAQPLEALQEVVQTALEKHCPKARPSKQARRDWSPRAAELLAGARQARRRYNAHNQPQDLQSHKTLANLLKKELRRVSTANWRRFVSEFTASPSGLWTLARWSRRNAGKPQADPHLPALRRTTNEPLVEDNCQKAQILSEKFFPNTGQADLSDTIGSVPIERTVPISNQVSKEELEDIIRKLPNEKAPGPDGIPNEVLKLIAPVISKDFAQAISNCLAGGSLPLKYKESTTVVLRKDGKKDYSLPSSYRPIALENTLAKVIEKILADRISSTAEEHALLPWNQMGARKQRSTLSAVGLLTSCVQTAWKARPGCVVSMLSLDLAGAFDNVSHERLLWILERKGFPKWLIQVISSFLTGRRTRIAFTGYESEWIQTQTGIPQGSPLSPILFLFFISELLAEFQRVSSDTLGFGFVDDTNLITWGDTAQDNCQRLTNAHDKCTAWAKRHGAIFAPDKYQLMHFTRKRRHPSEDLASTVRIDGHPAELEKTAMRVLGIWVDPKLQWKEHVQKATSKGNAAYSALSRITASTWGPSMQRSRLIYSAVVRPTMLYGSQVWSIQGNGELLPNTTIKPLQKAQNQCLRKITGGYKRTPTAALEREAMIPPIALYTELTALQRASTVRDHSVEAETAKALDEVWIAAKAGQGNIGQRPWTPLELLQRKAAKREAEIKRSLDHRASAARPHIQRRQNARREQHHQWKSTTLLSRWAEREWQKIWQTKARGRKATTWQTPWTKQAITLYKGLSKAESTALFLMRVEVIGLNAWLASVQVPGILPRCACGWQAQTVRHVLLHCPQYNRGDLIQAAQSESLYNILSQPKSARHAAKWLIRQNVLRQFELARAIEEEDTSRYIPFQNLERWRH